MQKKGLTYEFPVEDPKSRTKSFDYGGKKVSRPPGTTNCTTAIQECLGIILRGSGYRATDQDLEKFRGAKDYLTGGGPVDVLVDNKQATRVNSIQDIIPGDVIQRRASDGSGHASVVYGVNRDQDGNVTGFMSIEATKIPNSSVGGTEKNAIQYVFRSVEGEKVRSSSGDPLRGTFHIARLK